jgi:hypothetical protein
MGERLPGAKADRPLIILVSAGFFVSQCYANETLRKKKAAPGGAAFFKHRVLALASAFAIAAIATVAVLALRSTVASSAFAIFAIAVGITTVFACGCLV